MTRVTQSMLSNNMLRNLNTSYGKMSKLQDQINSGKIITRASDDPVVAVKGMKYRTDLGKIEQFGRNVNEAHTWLDTTDEALNQVGEALNRIKELVVQAANDSNTASDREKIRVEIQQIREQMRDVANAKVGDKSIFAGTNTQQPVFVEVSYYTPKAIQDYYDGLYDDTLTPPDQKQQDFLNSYSQATLEAIQPPLEKVTTRILNSKYTDENNIERDPLAEITSFELVTGTAADGTAITQSKDLYPNRDALTITSGNADVRVELFHGVTLNVNTQGTTNFFGKLDEFIGQVADKLDPANDPNHDDIQKLLGGLVDVSGTTVGKDTLSTLQGTLLTLRADVGARQNRVEVIENRLSMAEITVTKQMSKNEDTDYAKAITDLTTTESIHQAALSVGAKIIQQTLVDFMR